jgi:hypothetical protein
MSALEDLLAAFEAHSAEGIKSALDAGVDVHAPINGKRPIDCLIEMYYRSDQFPDCLRLMLDRGATLEDARIGPVLLNDAVALQASVQRDPSLIREKFSLNCTFTPLVGVTLLHLAAEYGHLEVAEKLIELGAEVDARADVDVCGMNGHTPLFHTVNSNRNRSVSVMKLLLRAGARTDMLLPGIVWGKGFDWETTCVDVTPISYAQLGLLPQMQRTEQDCYANVRTLLEAAARPVPRFDNLPNRYLRES